MEFKVSDKVYMKDDKPKESDIFVVVHKNNYQAPYMIIRAEGGYTLVNLHSGYNGRYKGESVEQLVENYLKANGSPHINPIKGYFFMKNYETKLVPTGNTFGFKAVEHKQLKINEIQSMFNKSKE